MRGRHPLLQVEHLTMRFGGLTAVDDLSFASAGGDITAHHRPQRRRQDHRVQLPHRLLQADRRRLALARHARAAARSLPVSSAAARRLDRIAIARDARVARTFQNIRLFPKHDGAGEPVVAQHNPLMRASGFTLLGLFGAPAYRRARARGRSTRRRYWLERISS
jgi:branched-chain amino acid transport system ATP-binding protein